MSLIQGIFRETPSLPESLFWLMRDFVSVFVGWRL